MVCGSGYKCPALRLLLKVPSTNKSIEARLCVRTIFIKIESPILQTYKPVDFSYFLGRPSEKNVNADRQHLYFQGQVSATYVPSHLHHILFEIFKNSMRATCEFSEKKGLSELPVWVFFAIFIKFCLSHLSCRIKCKIFKTKEDITIKISDQVQKST